MRLVVISTILFVTGLVLTGIAWGNDINQLKDFRVIVIIVILFSGLIGLLTALFRK